MISRASMRWRLRSVALFLGLVMGVCLLFALSVNGRSATILANQSYSVMVKVVPGTDVNQLSQDHQALLKGAVIPLSLYRLQSDDPQLSNNLQADTRVLSAYGDAFMVSRPSWFDASGQDQLQAQPSWFDAGGTPDPEYFDQWAAVNARISQAHGIAMGQGVVVAVLDTGVDLDHPWLANRLVPGYDFVDGDTNPGEETPNLDTDGDMQIDEAVGHGTHVAGVVALVAPQAMIMPVRVFDSNGSGSYFAVIEGIIYAVDNGARVINLSGNGPDDSPYLQEAITYARNHGVIVVAAGGVNTVGFPAQYPPVISVGAIDPADYVASFARYAPDEAIMIYAPGIAVYSAYYDNSSAWWSGNSMAVPFVAGGAALMMSTGNCNDDCVMTIISQATHPVRQDGQTVGRRLDLYDVVAAAAGQHHTHLRLQYREGEMVDPHDNVIRPYFMLFNEGNTVPLNEVTIRYWYTIDTEDSQQFYCEYAPMGCGFLTGSFTDIADEPGATHFLEVGFTASSGNFNGGTSTGELIVRFNKLNYEDFDESDDYSYEPGTADYTDWDHITAYHNGNLVWGSEPANNTPPSACASPAWDAGTAYVGGDFVSHNASAWQARWWTLNEEPGTTGEWGVWEELGACTPGNGGSPTATPAPTSTPAPTGTPQSAPTGAPTAPPPNPDNCTAVAWNASTAYVEGDVVTHNGYAWWARWWTYNEEPGTTGEWGVWEALNPCS